MNPKEIGVFLKQLRNEKGITQEQMAEILGVSGRTVSRWETGNNLPDLSVLVQISEYYDVEIKEILNGKRKSENIDSELRQTEWRKNGKFSHCRTHSRKHIILRDADTRSTPPPLY